MWQVLLPKLMFFGWSSRSGLVTIMAKLCIGLEGGQRSEEKEFDKDFFGNALKYGKVVHHYMAGFLFVLVIN